MNRQSRIVWINTGHRVQQDRNGTNRTSHRSGSILAGGDGNDAGSADKSYGRLESDDAIDRGGAVTEPSVSLPIAPAHRQADTATPEPELDPEGLRLSAYGLRVCPPRPLQPLTERVERKLAHSLRLVLPKINAPAARSRAATNASRGACQFSRASEPAVVLIRPAVSMLSFRRIGIPWRMPFAAPVFRSRSSRSASACTSGFNSMIVRSSGP